MEELAAVTSGKPIHSVILPGERWFIVDARWMDHWLEFCTSNRRMAPPGPIDNSWMLHAEKRYQDDACVDHIFLVLCSLLMALSVLPENNCVRFATCEFVGLDMCRMRVSRWRKGNRLGTFEEWDKSAGISS